MFGDEGHNKRLDFDDAHDEEDDVEEDEEGYASDPEIGTAKRTYNFREGGASPKSAPRRLRA